MVEALPSANPGNITQTITLIKNTETNLRTNYIDTYLNMTNVLYELPHFNTLTNTFSNNLILLIVFDFIFFPDVATTLVI